METKTPSTISASRIPAVLGLDKRVSPLTLFLRLQGKIGEKDLSHDEAVREGRFYERATAEIICAKYGMKLVDGFEQKEMVAGCLSGHPDFLAIDETGKLVILEVKNPFWSYSGGENDDDWGEPGTDEVPRAYLIQSMVYTHLFLNWLGGADHTDVEESMLDPLDGSGHLIRDPADYAYVVVKLRGGVERYKVPYDPKIIAVVEREVEMMLTRVRLDDPPSPTDEQDMRNRWVVDTKKPPAECNKDFVILLNTMRSLKQQEDAIQKQISAIKMQVLGLMQDAGELVYVNHETGERLPILTAKPTRAFDAKACWEQHRDLLIEQGYATVDKTRLRNEQKALYEAFMSTPVELGEQTRQIRLRDKTIDQIMGVS